MQRTRRPLIIALVATALLLLTFIGTTLLSVPIWFRYRDAGGLSTFRMIAQLAAALVAICFLISTIIIAISAALQPTSRLRKLLYVLPIYFLGFTLTGVILAIIGVGTAGPFITTWLATGAVLSIITALIAAIRIPLDPPILRVLLRSQRIASILSVVAWLGMVVSVVIVLTSQPSAQQPGQGGPGGPGGPGGSSTMPLVIGVILMTIFAAIEIRSFLVTLRIQRAMTTAESRQTPPRELPNYRHEAGQALFSSVVITILGLVVAQFIPITRTNPAPQTAITWDSEQTRTLASRACIDCHSNETVWPWYSRVAPASWLTASHVSDGREHFNLSELNNLRDFSKARLPQEIEDNIRSGSMPPADYLIMHPTARLSSAEQQQLIEGFKNSLAK